MKHKPLNLGQGFPDFAAPKHVTDALAEVAKSENILLHQYTRGYVTQLHRHCVYRLKFIFWCSGTPSPRKRLVETVQPVNRTDDRSDERDCSFRRCLRRTVLYDHELHQSWRWSHYYRALLRLLRTNGQTCGRNSCLHPPPTSKVLFHCYLFTS